MMACTEMITMCLQSAKQQHLYSKQQQQLLQRNPDQGISILQDIFRRADKNDDGKLSFEEFKNYFADGVLSTEELQELFGSIDRHQSSNLETEKLSASDRSALLRLLSYTHRFLLSTPGEYLNVLAALEKLNHAILNAMDKTKAEYQGSSVLGQFVTRFILRETSSQLHSLQASLECAVEAVEEQSCPGRKEVKKLDDLSLLRSTRKCGRRTQKGLCLSPTDPYSGMLTTGVPVEPDDHWSSQINRLQQLIDKLERQSPILEPLKEEDALTSSSNILLVQRQLSVAEKDLSEFQQALKSYVDGTAIQSDNLHVSIQKPPERSCFIMYEFWQDRLSWMSHKQSSTSKAFQRCIIDTLKDPEVVITMLLPGQQRRPYWP